MFRGADLSSCVAKVTGEMVMSFPANYVGQLGSCDQLQFQLNGTDCVERVLHNQHLLKRLVVRDVWLASREGRPRLTCTNH